MTTSSTITSPRTRHQPHHGPAPRGAVLVALGSDGSPHAVAAAAREARSRHQTIHLVRALPVPPVDVPGLAEAIRPLRAAAWEQVDRAVREAKAEHPGIGVSGDVVDAPGIDVFTGVVTAVGRAAVNAAMVVAERPPRDRVRTLVSSVTNGLARRSPVPVLIVPSGSDDRDHHDVVVLAAQDEHDLTTLMPLALDEAARRGASVVVVHASSQAPEVRPVLERMLTRTWGPAVTAAEAAARAAGVDPDARVRVLLDLRIAPRHPAALIAEVAEVADLVVLARRHHALPALTHLGPTSRMLLDTSDCPVLIAVD